jgi:amino acid permease-like protein
MRSSRHDAPIGNNEGRVTGKSLGVAACAAIVVGNMVGSGFYLSPAAVAPFGNLAILAWIVMGAGAVCLGLTFAKLARLVPATGGPYAYTRMAYGDFPGFLIAWGYWISIWTSLLVIAIAFAGAIFDLVPGLHNRCVWTCSARTIGAFGCTILRCGPDTVGLLGREGDLARRHPFSDRCIEWLDPSNGSSANGSRSRRIVSACFRKAFGARRARNRNCRLSGLGHTTGPVSGRGARRLLIILHSRRWTERRTCALRLHDARARHPSLRLVEAPSRPN